jgi:HlyD family secretion protein
MRLSDDELLPRINALISDVAVKKRERDNAEATGKAAERRSSEDGVANAERQIAQAREELDRVVRARRNGNGTDADLDKARDAFNKAGERLELTRATLRKTLASDSLPVPTRPEAVLVAARAELSMADAALERTRVRAPSSGTLLQVNAKVGETAAPSSPDNALVVMGDLGSLRVRAEFEERDISKLRVGQMAVVRSDAFQGRDFEGKVTSLAQALIPSRLGQRGPRKPTDVDVLEVIIDLQGQPPLLPGMRVDVFLRSDAAALPAAALGQPAKSASVN